VCSQSQRLRRRATIYCSGMDRCYLCLEDLASGHQCSFELKRATLYKVKGQAVRAIASSSRQTKDREQIAPQAMQV
jgi:hypothetical protein